MRRSTIAVPRVPVRVAALVLLAIVAVFAANSALAYEAKRQSVQKTAILQSISRKRLRVMLL